MLIQLIYRSHSRCALTEEALLALGTSCTQRNQQRQIFGMLLYDGEYFMQVLEGEESAIDALYARIVGDARHNDVVLLLRDPIPYIHFDQWRVEGLDMRESLSLSSSERWSRWCTTLGMQSHQEQRAERIVEAFVRGRWRDPVPAVTWFSERSERDRLPKRSAVPAHSVVMRGDERTRFALQPIVHTRDRRITSVEALLRGPHGESPQTVLASVPAKQLHAFDLHCKADAIALASALNLDCTLSINLLPMSLVCNPGAIDFLVQQCQRYNWPLERLVVEVTEEEAITHIDGFRNAVRQLRATGIQVAIDDFGAGHAGLSLLADFQPDKLKLDKSIIQGVQTSGPRQAIVRSVIEFCFCLGITVVAEGVETEAEWQWLQSAGVRRFQGYLFARPGFECVPPVAWSSLLDIDEANHALRQTQMNNLNRINTVV